MTLADSEYPINATDVFTEVFGDHWYDGVTAGIAVFQSLGDFRFDLITWDLGQNVRVFLFREILDREVKRNISSLEGSWSGISFLSSAEQGAGWGEVMASSIGASGEAYAIATTGAFDKLLAARRMDQAGVTSLDLKHDGHPVDDSIERWREFLGI